MIQRPPSPPGRLLNGNASSSHDDGKSGGNMVAPKQPNRVPLPAIGLKWPPWEPLNGSFVKVGAVLSELCSQAPLPACYMSHVQGPAHLRLACSHPRLAAVRFACCKINPKEIVLLRC